MACPNLSESRDCNTQPCSPEPSAPPTTPGCPQCSVVLTCINSGAQLVWGAASASSSDCPQNVFCSNKAPNIPAGGYWGCCSTLGATATYTFDCPDCAGNPGPYSSCNSLTPTPTPTPTQCQKNCGSSNGDGYCGLPDGCGGTCRCTQPNYHCENYSCVENPCGYCRYSYSNTFQEWQFSSDNCDPGCSCPETSSVNSNGSPSGCAGESPCTSCDVPCQAYSNFMFTSENHIDW